MIVSNCRQGDLITETGLSRTYTLKLPKAVLYDVFRAQVMSSELPLSLLPLCETGEATKRSHILDGRFKSSDLVHGDSVQVRRHLFSRREEYDIVQVDLRISPREEGLDLYFQTLGGRMSGTQLLMKDVLGTDTEAGSCNRTSLDQRDIPELHAHHVRHPSSTRQ